MANTKADKETVKRIEDYLKGKGVMDSNLLRQFGIPPTHRETVDPDPTPDAHDAGLITEMPLHLRIETHFASISTQVATLVPDSSARQTALHLLDEAKKEILKLIK